MSTCLSLYTLWWLFGSLNWKARLLPRKQPELGRLKCEMSHAVNDRENSQLPYDSLVQSRKNISIFLKGPIQTTLADHSAGIWEVNVSLCVCGHRVPCCTCCIWIWADPWSERADDKRECVNDDHSCRHTRHWSQACDGLHPRRILHGGDGQHDRWKRPGQLRECHCYHSQLPCWRPR